MSGDGHAAGRMMVRALRVLVGLLLILFEPELRAWQGRVPLARVFWIYGVLTSSGIGAFYLLAAEADRWNLQQGLLIVLATYTVWILVAVWRCAESAPPLWRLLARSVTVAWAVNTILLTGFLQLDLIASRLGE